MRGSPGGWSGEMFPALRPNGTDVGCLTVVDSRREKRDAARTVLAQSLSYHCPSQKAVITGFVPYGKAYTARIPSRAGTGER